MITPVALTPELLLAKLKANPHPKQTLLEMAGGFAYITINGQKIAYNGEKWFACGQQITPQFSMNNLHQEIDRVFGLAQKIKDHVLGTDTKEQTTMTAEADLSGNCVFRLLYDYPYPTMKYLRLSLDGVCRFFLNCKTWRFDCDAWEVGDEKIEHNLPAEEQVTAEMLHNEIRRVLSVLDKTTNPFWEEIKADCTGLDSSEVKVQFPNDPQPKRSWVRMPDGMTEGDDLNTEQTFVSTDRYRELEAELAKMTASRDEAQKKNDFINGQMSDLLAERDGLFAKINGLTVENERLKSKADRAGLLSVVCRRLCGDENASIETVHKALDLFDDQRNALTYIGERVGSDPDPTVPNRLYEIQSLAAQMSKSLSEKTAEVVKLQEGIKNYKAQVEGLTKRLEQMTFERDTERVGKKWLSESIEDLKRTTVKLPNEHTLRRLFNRHNAPDKYDDGTPIPTVERFLLIIENLCRNADCAERRFEELNAISTRVNTESEDAHATLDEMGIPRWTTAINNYNERYLSLSARIRSVFQTHTKV